MAQIGSYSTDSAPSLNDRVIGTEAVTGLSKNYQLGDIVRLVNGVAGKDYIQYTFSLTDYLSDGSFTTNASKTNPAEITKLFLNNQSNTLEDLTLLFNKLDTLQNIAISLRNPANTNNFATFKVTNITSHVDYFELDVVLYKNFYSGVLSAGTIYSAYFDHKVDEFIKSNESLTLAQRKDDVIYGILDQYTGEEITLSKVTGTPTVDNIIYFQLGSEYFKRVESDSIKSKTFGDLPISNVKMVKDLYEGKANTFLISNQAEFDTLNTIATNNATAKIYIKGGTYEYNEAHIYLNNLDGKDISISAVVGEEVNVISKGEKYQPKEAIEDKKTHFVCNLKDNATDFRCVTFIDENLNDLPKSTTGIRKADSLLTVTDAPNKVAKFKMPAELSYLFNKNAAYFKNSTLRISSLWRLNNCKIISSDVDGFLFFNYNEDSSFDIYYNNNGLQIALFSIDNVYTDSLLSGVTVYDNKIHIPSKVLLLHANKNASFIALNESNNAGFVVSDLNFKGSAIYGYNTFGGDAPVFSLYSNNNNFKVSNNTFKNIGGYVISAELSNNITIDNNSFEVRGSIGQIYGDNVFIYNNKVNGKSFYNGISLFQTLGQNINVYRNVIKNYIYNSISLNNQGRPDRTVSGKIYENLIYNDAEFSNEPQFALNDGGAIYLTNNNSGVIDVYDNVIHDIQGNQFSAIYLDDGCSNVNVKNNLLFNLSFLSISARNATQVGAATVAACINVTIENNILETFPWIGTSASGNNCKFNNNVLLNPNYSIKNAAFNFYNNRITLCNYQLLSNVYSQSVVKNNIVSFDDLGNGNRGSFIGSFLKNNYPTPYYYLQVNSEKSKIENINVVGVPTVYSLDAKYHKIDLYFIKKIEDVSVSFKIKATSSTSEEEFLVSVLNGYFVVESLTNIPGSSNKNKEVLNKIEAKIFDIDGIYNSGLSLFIKHSGLAGVIEYTFSDLSLRGSFDLIDANIFICHIGLVDALPGGTTNIYTGFFGKISGTTAELNANTLPVRNGHLFYNTDLSQLLEFSTSAAGAIWLAVSGNSGTFANKPTATYATVGHQYYCTNRQTAEGLVDGITITHKGGGVWVDALGRVVS